MSSDIYAKPDLRHKVRFNKKTEGDGSEWKEEEVCIYESADDVVNNQTTSQLQDEEQSQDQPEGKKKPLKRSTLFKTVLCIVALAGIIALTTHFILENIKLNLYSLRLDELSVNNSQLQKHLNQLVEEMKQMKNKTEELAEINSQMRNDSETLSIDHNLLKDEIKKLNKTIKDKCCCPDGWMRFGCSCYFKSTEKKTWPDSRKQCQDRGADLVIINSREEQEFVADLNQNGNSWIGLEVTKIGWSSEWRWVDGSPLTETFWETGWPQYTSDWSFAMCCSRPRKWKNSYNSAQLNWICEK